MKENDTLKILTPDYFYRGWPRIALKSESISYRNIDANSWLNTGISLCRVGNGSEKKLEVHLSESDPVALYEPTPGNALALRLIRYLATENFFLLLLAGQGNHPYARISKSLKFDQLRAAIKSIATEAIPTGLYEGDLGSVSYRDWVLSKLGASTGYEACETVFHFIAQQANFLDDRTFFNAIKHGRAATGITAPAGLMIDGIEQLPKAEQTWIWVEDWSEVKLSNGKVVSHTLNAETLSVQEELKTLFVLSLLVRNLVDIRAAIVEMKLKRTPSVQLNIVLPCDIAPSGEFIRIKGIPVHTE